MAKILFLSRWFPFPPDNGSKIRIANLLSGLSEQHEIILLSYSDHLENDRANEAARQIAHDLHVFPWKPYDPASLGALAGLFSATPRFLIDTFSPEIADRIQLIIQSEKIDLVIASQIDMARYAPFFQSLPAIFEELEVGVLLQSSNRSTNIIKSLRSTITWYKYRHYLSNLLSYFRLVTVASALEKQNVSQHCAVDTRIEVIPNTIDMHTYLPSHHLSPSESLIFTGSFRYSANYDAMVWFLSEVFPLIQAEIPGVQLKITGDHANKPLPTLQNVDLTGYVDDIQALISQAWCSLAPYRIGGGTRLKILEAMALGVPVVATPKGIEGLAVVHGQHALVAETPQKFSQAVLRVLREPELRKSLGQNGRQFVAENYDTQDVIPRFLDLVNQLLPYPAGSR